MQVEFYRPNSSNTGCGMSFSFVPEKDHYKPCVMINAIQQFSWDANKKIGNFSGNRDNPEANVIVKLGINEASEILSILDTCPMAFCAGVRQFPFAFHAFHKSGENSTQISFYPMVKTKKVFVGGKAQENPDLAYSIGIVQNITKKFSMLISHGDGRQLKEFLQIAIMNSHGQIHE